MNDQHTPGQHVACKVPDCSPLVQAGLWEIEAGGDVVCDMWRLDEETHDAIEFEDAECNAHLYAAAPDMLALLRKCVDEDTRYGKVSLGTVTDIRWLLDKLDGDGE